MNKNLTPRPQHRYAVFSLHYQKERSIMERGSGGQGRPLSLLPLSIFAGFAKMERGPGGEVSPRALLRDYWIILIAPLLLLGPLLARGQALFWGTPGLQFVPWWVYAWDSLRQGVLPLWNPLNGMGAPLLANYQLAFFYPPNWLLLALAGLGGPVNGAAAVAWGYTFLAMLHLTWTGLGMALLLRRLSFGWLGQVVGGLAFGLSGYMVARLGFFSMVWVAAWLPWVIFFADHIASMGRVEDSSLLTPHTSLLNQKNFVLLPGLVISLTMQLLAGHAQLTWYTLLLALAWVTVGAWRAGGLRRVAWAWLSLGAAAALAAGLAAVQLVPTFEYLRLSHRAGAVGYTETMTYSFWPWRFITLFSPDFFGNPAHGDYWGYASFWEDHLYAGMLPLLLALATLWLLLKGLWRGRSPEGRRPERWHLIAFAWLLCAVAFLLALGSNTPLFPFLYRHIPTFAMFQAPARYLIWVAFALPILAAVGIEHWRVTTGRRLDWVRRATVGAFGITLGAGLGAIFLHGVKVTFIRATALAGMWALGFCILTLALPYFQKRGWNSRHETARRWQWAVIVWTLADLLVTGWGLNPGVGLDFYAGAAPGTDQVQAAAAGQRVYLRHSEEYDLKFDRFLRFDDYSPKEDWRAMRGALLPNLNLLDGIPSANNFDPLLPADYARWMAKIETLRPEIQKAWLPWMGVGAIEHIDRQPGGVRFDAIPGAQRWRWYACKRTAVNGDDAWNLVQAEFGAPPRSDRAVILEDGAAEAFRLRYPRLDGAAEAFRLRYPRLNGAADMLDPCNPGSTADARVLSERPDQVTLEVNATGSGWLVLADTWYPGWQASIDGNRVPLYRADSLFRAVPVGAGKHKVIVNYRPSGFYFGALFSILVLLYALYQVTRWGRKSV